ncbi:nuclear transport factor 2 family protein [Rhodococcus erythropolis]
MNGKEWRPDESTWQKMLDREEIRTLVQLYCHVIWERDVDAYVDLFTADGGIISAGAELPQARGRDELRRVLASAMDTMQPRPFIHNHVITLLDGDRAEGVCYAEIYMIEDGKPVNTMVSYRDEYVRLEAGWRFRTRWMTVRDTISVSR